MTQDFLEQAQYLLKATGISATKGSDLIKSLDLKNEFIQIAEKKKHFMKQYVYSVKIELEFNDIYRSWM